MSGEKSFGMFAFATLSKSVFYAPHEEKSFVAWMKEHNYIFSGEEYQTRFGIWMANKRLVQEHNKGKSTFKLALNSLSHLTPAEYNSLLGFRSTAESTKVYNQVLSNDESLDWRDQKVVNPIKDQGQCGSCWAFSAIQAAESAWAINHNQLYSCSESNLVDCVTTCSGCNGGLMTSAYTYIVNKQGGKVQKESDYPYKPVEGSCKFNAATAVLSIKGYVNIAKNSDADLMAKVKSMGPAAVAIDASHSSFQLYSSGVYKESRCSPMFLDHGVGCVGYGSQDGTPYYIIRNSWGVSWGIDGYMLMYRGNNHCGIAAMACIPQVN